MARENDANLKDIVLKLKRFPLKSYENLDLDRLVIYVLFVLEKKKVPLYFDFICVGLFKLFPYKFSLATFTQYPDAYRINNAIRRTTGALSDQNKKRWATGTPEHGFYLTDTGREIAKQVERLLENPKLQHSYQKPSIKRSRGRSPADDMQEVRSSEAFRKWSMDEDVNNHEFFAFLKAAPYTPKELLAEHIKRLKTSATTIKDKEITEFLLWLEKKFSNLLS